MVSALLLWKISLIGLLLVFPSNVESLFTQNHRFLNRRPTTDFPEQYYTQKLDHFNVFDARTFQQRYYVNDLYWDANLDPPAPIFLYINGEGPVSGPPQDASDEVVLLAELHKGLIVTLEHRFYGVSVPFTDLRTENLLQLNTKQALEDLAQFITDYRMEISQKVGRDDIQIFTIGASYSGALSAWFRLKYPHITVGSISSSGVVNAILDFTAFDAEVATAAGSECADVLRATTKLLEQAVLYGTDDTKQQTKAKFQADQILPDDGDFFYMMGDIMAESVQYDFQDELCDPLLQSYQISGTDDLIDTFANFTVNFWYGLLGEPTDYSTAWSQNISVNEQWASRQWWWQTCSELGYFQNAPSEGSIRSSIVNMTYHRNHCRNVFGVDVWPDTDATNRYYGGNQTAGTKILFANGSQDPWKMASVLDSLGYLEPAVMITCHNCGHAVDVRGCSGGCDSPNALKEARLVIASKVREWLAMDVEVIS